MSQAQQSVLVPVIAAIAANEIAQTEATKPEAKGRNGSPKATLANLAESGRKGRQGAAKRFNESKGKALALDVPKLWAANAVTADGNPVRNQFAATLDAIRSALGLAKNEAVPEAYFSALKAHSREEASAKAASFHNFHTVGRIKQSERGALLKVGGFGLDRTTATRHLDLPIVEQIRAGRMALASVKTSLAKLDERFINADLLSDKEDIAERAQSAVSKSVKMAEELVKLGEQASQAPMPEAIGTWLDKREASRKASEEALAARRAEPRIGKPKADKPRSHLGETGVPTTTVEEETDAGRIKRETEEANAKAMAERLAEDKRVADEKAKIKAKRAAKAKVERAKAEKAEAGK